jgi:hypothetical protein
LSEKDLKNPLFKDANTGFVFGEKL